MRKIQFIKLYIENFKGITEPVVDEFDLGLDWYQIELANGKGKTTRLDAISYLFTNKLLNGSTTGWEHLDSNNEINPKLTPTIKVTVRLIEGVDGVKCFTLHEIKLENGKRSIDGVSFSTLKAFTESIEKLVDFPMNKFHLLVNPHYLLEYVDTKTARNLFLDSYPFDMVREKISKKETFTDSFWNKIKISKDPSILLSSVRSDKNNLMNKIKSREEMTLEFKELTQDEKDAESNINQLKEKTKSINDVINNYKLSLDINCKSCNQPLPNKEVLSPEKIEFIKMEINKNEETLNSLKSEMIFLEHILSDKKQKEYYNDEITKIKTQGEQELNKWRDELTSLTFEENEILKYQDLRVQALKELISDTLPFTLKLFHKNKSTSGYSEVFTLLDNGVDYKYLNSSKKLEVGVILCQFFQKSMGLDVQMLIDNFEVMDEIKSQEFSNKFPNIITTKVK